MAYGMTYAEGISEYDSALAGNGYKIIVDAVALNFLKGCEIDFAQDSRDDAAPLCRGNTQS